MKSLSDIIIEKLKLNKSSKLSSSNRLALIWPVGLATDFQYCKENLKKNEVIIPNNVEGLPLHGYIVNMDDISEISKNFKESESCIYKIPDEYVSEQDFRNDCKLGKIKKCDVQKFERIDY